MSQKVAFGVEYDGHRYSGWQRQKHTRETVQEHVELAISKVANEETIVYCAGRTDRGVHALGQVIHIETGAIRPERSWVRGVNTHLPGDIAIQWAKTVQDNFHARYKAFRRSYSYIINNTRTYRSAINHHRTTWIYKPLNAERMREASGYLLGTHDYSSFRASMCQAKSPVKTVHHIDVYRHGDLVVIEVEADAFLHHMVRNIAGVLITIGYGEQPVEWCKDVLEAKDRKSGGVTAQAEGLYLTGVRYPEEFAIPQSQRKPIII